MVANIPSKLIAVLVEEGRWTAAQGLASVQQSHASSRAHALAALAPYLPEPLLPQALDVARKLQSESE